MRSTTSSTSAPGITHHTAAVNGTQIHYVSAGTTGSPVLLVHGFPETWWAFHRVIPLLAERHQVFAVDLRGFGDSRPAEPGHDSTTAAADLHALIGHLGVGPVHLTGQDISGATVFRLAATHPEDVRSLTAVETGLPGFGVEALGDVTHGGSWHLGALAAPGIPELFLTGRERELVGWAFSAMTAVDDPVTEADVDELVRTYSRPGGWTGAAAHYRSMFADGDEIRSLAATSPLTVPVLAVGAAGGPFTAGTLRQVTAGEIRDVRLDGVGHYVALEAPAALATTLLNFLDTVDTP
jgi:pimeloyl-ACP methyl ester carboxylesterase